MRILYVCTGNCFRSPTAEALTRKYKDIEVESAGTNPTNFIANVAKELLEKDKALKYVKKMPDPITQRAIDEADVTIVMEEDHKKYIEDNFKSKKIIVWHIEDPIMGRVSPETAFNQIKAKVKALAT